MKHQRSQDFQPMNKIKQFCNQHPEVIAFLLVSAIVFWLNLRDAHGFYHDSAHYWDLRRLFDRQEKTDFSLLNYDEPLRSYFLPLLYYSISRVAIYLGIQDEKALAFIQAMVYSGMLTILIPRAIHVLFQRVVNFWQIILFSLLVIAFWQGYFYYPLSDFWALFFFFAGLYIFLWYFSASWVLPIVGACWGATFLIRPSYFPGIILLLFWVNFFYHKQLRLSVSQIVFKFSMIVLGITITCIPQLLINLVHFDILSPLPQTQLFYGGNLFLKQLSWGIEIQRYETFVGPQSGYPSPAVFFVDRHGASILTRSGLGPFPVDTSVSFLTLPEYVSLVLRYPLDFFVLYCRHLLNGLDVVYNTPYVYNLYQNTVYIRLINYSIWFLVLLIINKDLKASDLFSYQFLLLLIFVTPALMAIPTAVEVRFMLPFYFIAYSVVAFYVIPLFASLPYKEQIKLILRYAPWYIAFVCICLILSSNTFSNLKYGTYLFWE